MLVDGKPVQIKEGLAGVKQFLAEHHGIDVFTGHDVAAAVKDPLVHGLGGISTDHIHAITHHSLEAVRDTFSPSFHFPFITLVFSAYRESKLLLNESITVPRAVKNVGMDVAGVGAGATAGAQVGAYAGAWLGPLGAAAGGLLGGVIGGISGKMASTHVRHAPYSRARSAYEESVSSAERMFKTEAEISQGEVRMLQMTHHSRFLQKRNAIVVSANAEIMKISENYSTRFARFCMSFVTYLYELDQILIGQERSLLVKYPESQWRVWLLEPEAQGMRRAIRA